MLHGPVDQLEDRYLGMVEAASSNLARSTLHLFEHRTCKAILFRF
jgi:hypothetical protein